MLAQRSPHEAYRRVDFDARVTGAGPAELVHLCYEQLVGALGTAIHADAIGDNSLKSRSLTRALTAVTALQLGTAQGEGVAAALRQVYEAARRAILESATAFDSKRVEALRQDFLEIGDALRAA
jgi:flagellar protein FliS